MSDSLEMSVSSICRRDGEKVAYVEFKDDTRLAEGIIPSCKILSSRGFNDNEITQLEQYMKDNLDKLKKMSAGINLFEALKK